jgi:hypothetical protein
MKASQGNRRSLGASVLFAAVAGLAVSASGCIIDGSSNNGCSPDLTVSWRIISDLDGQVITCGEAGGADTVTAWIDSASYALTPWDSSCPANQAQGSFVVPLPHTDTYDVTLELHTGGPNGTLLSETPILVQPVDCSGLSQTPRADLHVNL